MTMSYDYENRRERNQPTNQKRRRGERPAVPLDQRPENRRSVPQRSPTERLLLMLFLLSVLAFLVALLGRVVGWW